MARKQKWEAPQDPDERKMLVLSTLGMIVMIVLVMGIGASKASDWSSDVYQTSYPPIQLPWGLPN